MKKYVLLLGLLIQAVSVLAQETSVGKSIFSVHAGPSWYLGKMIGITNNSDAYRNDLRNGIAWYNRQNEKYEFSKRKVQEETFEYSLNEVRTSLFHSVILYPFERSHIEFKQDIFTTFN